MNDRERRQVKKKKEKCIECDMFTWVKENQRCDSCDPTRQGGQANMEDKDNNKGGEEPTTKAREEEAEASGGRNNCGKCKVEVKKKDNAIMCDLCSQWFHAGCGKCSQSLYRVLQEEKEQLWFCQACKSGVVQNCAEVKRLKDENRIMKQHMQELEEKYDELTKNMKKSDDGWKVKEGSIVDKAVKEAVMRMEQLLEESERQREEREDKERRRKNLIVFNMPESTKEQGKDREREDAERCDSVWRHFECRRM